MLENDDFQLQKLFIFHIVQLQRNFLRFTYIFSTHTNGDNDIYNYPFVKNLRKLTNNLFWIQIYTIYLIKCKTNQ